MKAVIQRVKSAKVQVDGAVVGSIGVGFLVLLGVAGGDTEKHAALLARKTAMLRIIEDDAGKMNRSLLDIGGEVLCVSQFTLCADVRKGNRPSFTPAADPALAEPLYNAYCEALRSEGIGKVEKGVFGADMLVTLENDGPVTILLDTDIWM
ncbi:MAG: D-tyrosyl-tRNA(Tyr) deacylase [Clostridia bacterium]|nr:D-tyrosyl-tRNA(Tyr) deacylase [Clostridia bacterium]